MYLVVNLVLYIFYLRLRIVASHCMCCVSSMHQKVASGTLMLFSGSDIVFLILFRFHFALEPNCAVLMLKWHCSGHQMGGGWLQDLKVENSHCGMGSPLILRWFCRYKSDVLNGGNCLFSSVFVGSIFVHDCHLVYILDLNAHVGFWVGRAGTWSCSTFNGVES